MSNVACHRTFSELARRHGSNSVRKVSIGSDIVDASVPSPRSRRVASDVRLQTMPQAAHPIPFFRSTVSKHQLWSGAQVLRRWAAETHPRNRAIRSLP